MERRKEDTRVMQYKEGNLLIGVEYCGKLHKTYKMRLQTVGDTLDLPEELITLRDEIIKANEKKGKENDKSLPVKVNKFNAEFNIHIMSKVIVSIGDIPQDKITTDLIKSMTEIDLQYLVNEKGAWEVSLIPFLQDFGGKEQKNPCACASKDGVSV